MSRINPEAIEQTKIFNWAAVNLYRFPELKLMYHVPNGGSRNKIEAVNLKRQGVKRGVPDICLPVPRGEYHGLYIELKAGKNTPTKEQKEWLTALNGQGYYATVCRGCEQAISCILNYLKGDKK